MARPDRIRNGSERPLIALSDDADPTRAAMPQAPAATTSVRSAVATVEFVVATPAFARIEVSPAKRADRQAARIHIVSTVGRDCRTQCSL